MLPYNGRPAFCIFGGFRVIVLINIFVHALSPDKARRAYLQCFYVFLLCQMNVSNTFPFDPNGKQAYEGIPQVDRRKWLDTTLYLSHNFIMHCLTSIGMFVMTRLDDAIAPGDCIRHVFNLIQGTMGLSIGQTMC